MLSTWPHRPVRLVLLTFVLGAGVTGAQPQDDAADAARIIAVLGVKPGSVVAAIGAG